jgi:hypothetical protein
LENQLTNALNDAIIVYHQLKDIHEQSTSRTQTTGRYRLQSRSRRIELVCPVNYRTVCGIFSPNSIS